jgi:hypothetical protein
LNTNEDDLWASLLLSSIPLIALFTPISTHTLPYKDWLMTSDKVQHVLDLVRIDGERIANSGGGTGSRSNDSCDALVNALVMRSDLFVDAK